MLRGEREREIEAGALTIKQRNAIKMTLFHQPWARARASLKVKALSRFWYFTHTHTHLGRKIEKVCGRWMCRRQFDVPPGTKYICGIFVYTQRADFSSFRTRRFESEWVTNGNLLLRCSYGVWTERKWKIHPSESTDKFLFAYMTTCFCQLKKRLWVEEFQRDTQNN